MNRATRRAAAFKRGNHWDRNDVAPSSVLRPIRLCAQFTEAEAAILSVETRMAWQRLISGDGIQDDFDLLANSSNVALIRAEDIDELAVDMVLRAQAAIIAMKARYQRLGKFGPDAAALADVPPMLDFYDSLLSLGSPKLMTDALMEAVQRMQAQREEA